MELTDKEQEERFLHLTRHLLLKVNSDGRYDITADLELARSGDPKSFSFIRDIALAAIMPPKYKQRLLGEFKLSDEILNKCIKETSDTIDEKFKDKGQARLYVKDKDVPLNEDKFYEQFQKFTKPTPGNTLN